MAFIKKCNIKFISNFESKYLDILFTWHYYSCFSHDNSTMITYKVYIFTSLT